MVQVGGGRDLAQKALGPEGVDQLGTEDLYGYLAIMLEVVSEIDRSHPARAKLAVEAVALGQGCLKSGLEIGQVGRRRRECPNMSWRGPARQSGNPLRDPLEGIPATSGM